MVCRDCGEEFETRVGKPGYIDQCESCANDVALLGGNMVWSHKTSPEIEVKPMSEAKLFARKQKRLGAGPLSSIVEGKEKAHRQLVKPGDEDKAAKQGSGAEARAEYTTKLGEKRSVKQ